MAPSNSNRPGLLIVNHGTRVATANETFHAFARKIAEERPDWHVRSAHMELAEPGFAVGIDGLVADGALEIHIHLHFLGTGYHVRETIPELVEQARVRHPQIEISVSQPLGSDPRLVDLVVDRMDAHREGAPDPE